MEEAGDVSVSKVESGGGGMRCVCGYEGDFHTGSWGCYNDSCGSSYPASEPYQEERLWKLEERVRKLEEWRTRITMGVL